MSNPLREAANQASIAREIVADAAASEVRTPEQTAMLAALAAVHVLLAIHYDLAALVAKR